MASIVERGVDLPHHHYVWLDFSSAQLNPNSKDEGNRLTNLTKPGQIDRKDLNNGISITRTLGGRL
jgi:hypothetical protein